MNPVYVISCSLCVCPFLISELLRVDGVRFTPVSRISHFGEFDVPPAFHCRNVFGVPCHVRAYLFLSENGRTPAGTFAVICFFGVGFLNSERKIIGK